jgi:hypothetical protein
MRDLMCGGKPECGLRAPAAAAKTDQLVLAMHPQKNFVRE